MTLAMDHFTPLAALSGGLLIGLAIVLLMWVNGRVAGISGILGGLLGAPPGERGWRAVFVIGLLASPWLFRGLAPLPETTIAASPLCLIVAGLLVGIGTRYASGCTSGHGVCGLARGSGRSLAATATFMAVGFGTVLMTRHLLRF